MAAGRQKTFSRRYGQRHRHRQPTVPGHPGESCGPVGSDQSQDSAGYKQICLECMSFHNEIQMLSLRLVCVCACAAFEDMLENPLNSTQWMNDPETGPVMLQISRIFQTLNRT